MVDRPQLHNPIGEPAPVYVHEEVLVDRYFTGMTKPSQVVKFPKGSRITIREAQEAGVPLLDAAGNALQAEKPEVQTQDVKGPRRRRG